MIHGGIHGCTSVRRAAWLRAVGHSRRMGAGDIPALDMAVPLGSAWRRSWCDDMAARRAMVRLAGAKRWFADGATFLGRVKSRPAAGKK